MSSVSFAGDLFGFDDATDVETHAHVTQETTDEDQLLLNQYKEMFDASEHAFVPERTSDSPIDTMLIVKEAEHDHIDEPLSFEKAAPLLKSYVLPTMTKKATSDAYPMRSFVDTTLSKFPFPELAVYNHTLASFCLFRWYYLWDVPAPALRPHMGTPWNPCSNPVTLDEINVPLLKQYPYIVSTKTNGIRVQVLIITHPTTHSPMLFMVDRNTHFYDVGASLIGDKMHELCEGSILDGELVERTDGVWAFVLFDVIAIQNRTVRRVPSLQYRLETVWSVYEELPSAYMPNCVRFLWMTKSMFSIHDPKAIDKVLSEERPYATDGLVFVPLLFGVPFETSPFLFKWKPDELYSVDFRLVGHPPTEARPWGLELKYKYQSKERNLLQGFWFIGYMFSLGNIRINSSPALQDILSEWSRGSTPHSCIVECKLDRLDLEKQVMEWSIVRTRTDKSEPNSDLTLLGTLKTIMFPLSLNKLKQATHYLV